MLIDAADELLGRREVLPGVSVPGRELVPGARADVLRRHAGLPQEDAKMKSQLLTLGEFLCMYLSVWSDVLWPAELAIHPTSGPEGPALRDFRAGLPAVRRALANVP